MTQSRAPIMDTTLGSGAMFDAIARRYDLLNRVLSFGSDQRWRRRTVRALELRPGAEVLDVATGTADLAIACARAGARVTGVDPSAGMLEVGERKVADAGLGGAVTLVRGDAQALAFPDARFDAACMAFGIRNVADRPRALGELARVVRPGGRIAILELGEPRGGLMSLLARVHIHVFVPIIGSLLSSGREYRYLQASIAAFPPSEKFVEMVRAAGFADVAAEPLTFGVSTLFSARRP